LVSFETVGIDGTKIRAQNNVNNIFRRRSVHEVIEKIDEKIKEYLSELDSADSQKETTIEINRENIEKRIESLKKQKSKAQKAEDQFKKDSSVDTICVTDSDARMMSDKGKIRPSYNAQTAVDAKNKLIVVADVTNEANDRKQLTPMLLAIDEVKKEHGIEHKTDALADAGYHASAQIMPHKESTSFDVIVPSPKDSPKPQKESSVPRKEYRAEEFTYSKRKDTFTCPHGRKLYLKTKTEQNGIAAKVYECHSCGTCRHRALCVRGEGNRTISMRADNKEMEAYRKRMMTPAYQAKIKKRKELCEHPFGTIKYTHGIRHFLLRGVEKVKSEFMFTSFIYNLRRSLSIVGCNGIMKALRT
jgi:hypothetical protein